MSDDPPPHPLAVFSADEEIGPDLARVAWEATPLGAPADWPQSLQTAVNILLSSRFSMWMAWGPELTFFCNAAYRRDTLGRKYPWALGRPIREVWTEIWDDVGPRIESVLSTGQATWDSELLLFLERSGYQEETYHTFSYSPLRDDDRRIVGILCVVSEDTQQVISERRMATLRDLGSDPSVVRTEREIMAFADRQLAKNSRDLPFTLTYLFDDSVGAYLAGSSGIPSGHPCAPAVLTEDDVWPLTEPARGDTVLVELDPARYPNLPAGDWRAAPTQALVVPLLQQGGSPSGFLVAALNRYRPLDEVYRGFVTLVAGHIAAGIGSARSYQTQQRRAEELTELDRAKTTFFSNISHEFRTPLTLILDPVAELRGRGAELDEQARQELDIVWRNGLRLAKLVNTLLDFSRIEAGRMKASYMPVDLGAVTADLASVFRSAIERAGLTFTVDCPPLHDAVYIDRDMWEKVVFNLLSNALKFTFDGAISVSVRHGDGEAVVTVADTGVGIAAQEIPRLFERFHRIENVRARSNEGSGIGLALVKELIELHGGSISAESAEGHGTTFTIRLPLGAAHLPEDAIAAAPGLSLAARGAEPFLQEALRWLPTDEMPALVGGVATDGASPIPAEPGVTGRVLIADDNADMRDYVARLLRGDGYEVDAVTDGQLALDAVRADVPDMVISDVMMPRMDGLALVGALRSDPRTAAVPVLLLSARAGQEAAIDGLQAGADDYLVKPFAAAELLARVRANVKLARLRNHHARWRTALIDSLQEAFFVGDEQGAVIEMNAAFTDILGYGPEGLPYSPPQPWWPSAESDADAHRQVTEVFARVLGESQGRYTVPVTHRDGHRLWVTLTFNRIEEMDTGRRVIVGTLRDVTAEHYTVQRESALASLNQQLAQADTLRDAVQSAADELRALWRAHRVLAVTFPDDVEVDCPPSDFICLGEQAQWDELPERTRAAIQALRHADQLLSDSSDPGTARIALQSPRGVLVLHIELQERRPFTTEDHTLLTVLASRLGQGLQRVHQLDQQRETALVLQHAILGPTVSSGFAVRYQPATHPLQVGGDWYDVLNLDDGRIALIVGDCVGHGLASATVMGQLRSACRALLLEHPSPAAALSAVDRFAARLPGARCTTAFCAVLSPRTGELVYSSAGHPPPILVSPSGDRLLLDDASATPLGLPYDHPRPEAHVQMPPRATLLLYTDGLVERRREALDKGIGRAADIVQNNSASALDDLADEIMTRLTPSYGYQDDVALMLYRQPVPLEIELAADANELAPTRNALREWLTQAGIDPTQTLDVLIATGEALANSIEHGHRRSSGGTVSLRAIALADRLHLTIVDNGEWKPPRPDPAAHRGRGIALMRALMHDVSIESGASGTTINMQARIA